MKTSLTRPTQPPGLIDAHQQLLTLQNSAIALGISPVPRVALAESAKPGHVNQNEPKPYGTAELDASPMEKRASSTLTQSKDQPIAGITNKDRGDTNRSGRRNMRQVSKNRGQADDATGGTFITPEDWADRLQVSKRTVFRWIDERVIPQYDFAVGKTRRWHRSTFDAWVNEQTGRN